MHILPFALAIICLVGAIYIVTQWKRAKSDFDIATMIYLGQIWKGLGLFSLLFLSWAFNIGQKASAPVVLCAAWYLFSASPMRYFARRRYSYPFADPVNKTEQTTLEKKKPSKSAKVWHKPRANDDTQ